MSFDPLDNSDNTKITSRDLHMHNSFAVQCLLGELGRNKEYLEATLFIRIQQHRKGMTISGRIADIDLAEEIVRKLYESAQQSEMLTEDFIKKTIKSFQEPTMPKMVDGKNHGRTAIKTPKKTIMPRSDRQGIYMSALVRDDIIFALGPAGTGKTYLAVAQAVSQLVSNSVEKIILSRPAVEAGEKLGFLPGDMKEKVDPYLRPIYDALHDCLPAEQVERRIASGEIEIAPLAFMRGRTLANAFIVLDEAQNTTAAQMKMFLTRFGENSTMVVCGDQKQNDLGCRPEDSGLMDAVKRLENVDGISAIKFESKDVVRHSLVGKIVEAYDGEGS